MLDNSKAQVVKEKKEPGYTFLTYDNGNSAIVRDDGTLYSEKDAKGNEWHYKKDESIDYTVEVSENGTLSYFDEKHILCFEKKPDTLVSYYEGVRNYEVDEHGNTTYFRADGETVFCKIMADKSRIFFRSNNTKACEFDYENGKAVFYKDDGETIDHVGERLVDIRYYTQDGKEDFIIMQGYAVCVDGDKKTSVHFDGYGWFNRFHDRGYKSDRNSAKEIQIGGEEWGYHRGVLEKWHTRDGERRKYEYRKLKERHVNGHTLIYDGNEPKLVSDYAEIRNGFETIYYQDDGETPKSKEISQWNLYTRQKMENGISGKYSLRQHFTYSDEKFVLASEEVNGYGWVGNNDCEISASKYYQEDGEKLLKEILKTKTRRGSYSHTTENHYREDGKTLLKKVEISDYGREETFYREDGKTVDYIKDKHGIETHYDETGNIICVKDAKGNITYPKNSPKKENKTDKGPSEDEQKLEKYIEHEKIDHIVTVEGIRTDRDGIPDNGLAQARRKAAKIFGLQDVPTSRRFRSGENEVYKRFVMAQRWAKQVLGADKSDN